MKIKSSNFKVISYEIPLFTTNPDYVTLTSSAAQAKWTEKCEKGGGKRTEPLLEERLAIQLLNPEVGSLHSCPSGTWLFLALEVSHTSYSTLGLETAYTWHTSESAHVFSKTFLQKSALLRGSGNQSLTMSNPLISSVVLQLELRFNLPAILQHTHSQ